MRLAFSRLALLLPGLALAACAGSQGPNMVPGTGLSGAQCLAVLSDRAVAYQTVAGTDPKDSRCAIDTAVRVSRETVSMNRPATMSCALAARLDQFEREAVQPIALQDLGVAVTRLDHLGAFSCRAQSSGRTDRLSQHAYGNAIDIGGFQLAGGGGVNVERDWRTDGPKHDFLRHLAKAACRYFSVVLTPDSNLEHYNHFHLDIGPGKLCSGI